MRRAPWVRDAWRVFGPLLILFMGMALITCVAPPPEKIAPAPDSEVSAYAY